MPIQLIAYVPEQGAAFCLMDDALFCTPMSTDYSLRDVDEQGLDWGCVYDMGDEEQDVALRPVVEALGGDWPTVRANFLS